MVPGPPQPPEQQQQHHHEAQDSRGPPQNASSPAVVAVAPQLLPPSAAASPTVAVLQAAGGANTLQADSEALATNLAMLAVSEGAAQPPAADPSPQQLQSRVVLAAASAGPACPTATSSAQDASAEQQLDAAPEAPETAAQEEHATVRRPPAPLLCGVCWHASAQPACVATPCGSQPRRRACASACLRAGTGPALQLFFAKVPRSAPRAAVEGLFARYGEVVELNLFMPCEVRCARGSPGRDSWVVWGQRARRAAPARARRCCWCADTHTHAPRARIVAPLQGSVASKGCGLVVLKTAEQAAAALAGLEKHVWSGMHSSMVLKLMQPGAVRTPPPHDASANGERAACVRACVRAWVRARGRRAARCCAHAHTPSRAAAVLTTAHPYAACHPPHHAGNSQQPGARASPRPSRASSAAGSGSVAGSGSAGGGGSVLSGGSVRTAFAADAPPPGCGPGSYKLFIGNLPKTMSEPDLLPVSAAALAWRRGRCVAQDPCRIAVQRPRACQRCSAVDALGSAAVPPAARCAGV
jgi:hypothetical protein